jgi:hypothetical protein
MPADAAHIYPFNLVKATSKEPTAVARFWDLLRLFWDETRINKWRRAIFSEEDETISDGCHNMLTLSKQAHALWGEARFALRPLEQSDDQKRLKVEFHWQKKALDADAEIDLLSGPESTRDYHGERECTLTVEDSADGSGDGPHRGYRRIRSGDTFTFRTTDPKRLPLPSWPLLEMQWYLQRIAAMSGAAGPPEYEEYSEEDDNAPGALSIDCARRVGDVFEWVQTGAPPTLVK